jgi:hypothetical protein
MVVRGVASVCTLEHIFPVYLQLGEEGETIRWNSRVLGAKQEDLRQVGGEDVSSRFFR